MSLSETELKIGKTSFKGVYIAIVLSMASSLSAVIWSASSLYARLEAVEARKIPDTTEIQNNLVKLGTNLDTIMDQQKKLLELKSDVDAMRTSVTQAEIITKSMGDVDERIKMIDTDLNELWEALDYLSGNPLN
jgi:hypothetical protein